LGGAWAAIIGDRETTSNRIARRKGGRCGKGKRHRRRYAGAAL